jgi:hypothetical protein
MAVSTWGVNYKCSSATSNTMTSDWLDCTTAATVAYRKISPKYLIEWGDLYSDHLLKIEAGQKKIDLPDGAKLVVDDAGNYRIEDNDAKVTYRANRIRDFSPHLNASDMVAAFVRYVGSLGLRQRDVLGLPIELFINWLVIEAAERDSDPIPADVLPVSRHPMLVKAIRPQCLKCGRFIPRVNLQRGLQFCGVEHGIAYVQRLHAKQLEDKSLATAG